MSIIDKPSDYFNTVLYTGNASTQTITGVGFQPDMSWFKVRSEVGSHRLADSVRGNTKYLYPNGNDGEATTSTNITSWNSDGFALGNGSINESSRTYASWNWKANGSGSLNEVGSIDSTVSANTTSGFSIVSYTGTASLATVGHGLGTAPKMIIVKTRGGSGDWSTYHASLGNTKNLKLNTTAAAQTSASYWNNTSPTSSVFTINDEGNVNGSSINMIAYCFAEKQGYSKFGSYTGNGSTDGTFVYTGMKPAFVITRRTDVGNHWEMFDNKRNTFNLVNNKLLANESDAENIGTANAIDFLSNGFKCRATNAGTNTSGGDYIYMAFASSPFTTSSGVPTTAR